MSGDLVLEREVWKEISKYLPMIEKEFENLNKEEVIKRFASLEFNRFLNYYRFAEDLNMREARGENRERSVRKGDADLMFINLGKMDHMVEKDLVEMIKQVGGLKPNEIGDIRLKGAYSFFEVPANMSEKVVRAFNGFIFRGRRVRIEIQNERQERNDFPKKKAGGRDRRPMKRR